VACRRVRPKRDLLRVVRRPDGSIGVDPTGRANGRGAYVCDEPDCRDRAIGRGGLARALAGELPGDVVADLRAAR
jgi:predicted RNA-binding protein YlxR (DUF448 family)